MRQKYGKLNNPMRILKILDTKRQRIQQIGNALKTKHVAENYINFAIIIENRQNRKGRNLKLIP